MNVHIESHTLRGHPGIAVARMVHEPSTPRLRTSSARLPHRRDSVGGERIVPLATARRQRPVHYTGKGVLHESSRTSHTLQRSSKDHRSAFAGKRHGTYRGRRLKIFSWLPVPCLWLCLSRLSELLVCVLKWSMNSQLWAICRAFLAWVYGYPERLQFWRTTSRFTRVMRSTESYQIYMTTARSLDQHWGIDKWRTEAPPTSCCNAEGMLFDAHVALALATSGNEKAMEIFMRTALRRDAHGVMQADLFAYFSCTKGCVEDYHTALVQLIEAFAGSRAPQDVGVHFSPCRRVHPETGKVVDLCTYMSRDLQPSRKQLGPSPSSLSPPPCSASYTCPSKGTTAAPVRLSLALSNDEDNGNKAVESVSPSHIILTKTKDSLSMILAEDHAAPDVDNDARARLAMEHGKSTYLFNLVEWAHDTATASEDMYSAEGRCRILRDVLRTMGRTALVLSGGASMGTYHAGVVRALFEADILPDIFSGSSAGSIIAALICTKEPTRLRSFIQYDVLSLDALQLTPFGQETDALYKIKHLFRTGSLLDVRSLMECLRSNCGDMTFLEAYQLTGKTLNICLTRVHQKGTNTDRHALVNHRTAPNVVIWSAVSASCALPGIFTAVQLIEKDLKKGTLRPYLPGELWCDGSVAQDVPHARLAELFNVTYFIVSQVNPYVIPFMSAPFTQQVIKEHRSILARLWFAATGELRHWLISIFEHGILSKTGPLEVFYLLLTQHYSGNVTIFPIGSFLSAIPDYLTIVNNPSSEYISFVASTAQNNTWPHAIRIHYATVIERCLVREIEKLEEMLARTQGCSV